MEYIGIILLMFSGNIHSMQSPVFTSLEQCTENAMVHAEAYQDAGARILFVECIDKKVDKPSA